MARRRAAADAEIARRLEMTPAPGTPNRIQAEELRGWAVAYLRDQDEELARFPDLAGQPHWNLWMMDARFQDAIFAVLIFRPTGIELFCGTGNAREVRQFAESDCPENPDEVLAAMRARFFIPEASLRLDRRAAEGWLGRSW